MKNEEILSLNESLNAINLPGVKFAYGVAKNIGILKPEIESLQQAVKHTDAYKVFDKERIELARKHAEKDEKGRPVMEGNNFKITDEEAFGTELTALKEKHAEAIKEREAQLEEFNDLLKKDAEVSLFKVKMEDVPAAITTKQMSAIFPMIEE